MEARPEREYKSSLANKFRTQRIQFRAMVSRRMSLVVFAMFVCGQADASNRIAGDISSISAALKMFERSAGRYPTEEEGLKALIEKPATYPESKRWQKVMDRMPLDPWNNPYQYVVIGDPAEIDQPFSWSFDGMGLYSFGPDGMSNSRGNDADDYRSWDESSLDKRPVSERIWESSVFRCIALLVGPTVVIALVLKWNDWRYRTP